MSLEPQQAVPPVRPSFDLTCWYIHWRRVAELVGVQRLRERLLTIPTTRPKLDGLEGPMTHAAFKDALLDWFRSHEIRTLQQQLIQDDLAVGSRFTCYWAFYCRGLQGLSLRDPPPEETLAEIHAHIRVGPRKCHLRVYYRPAYLWAMTAWDRLSGRSRLITLGAVTRVSGSEVTAEALMIADMHPVRTLAGRDDYDRCWRDYGEVHVDDIDTFSRVQDEPYPDPDELAELTNVPEQQLKKAFAEIAAEPRVPADWGGERSDLFTTHIQLRGQRVSTAFLFKGPSQFRPLTLASLGKKGDQIDRLFSEPAELFVLQHCHEIEPPIRGAMRAYANSASHPRSFCLIDGHDTLRVLRAYAKCGFSPSTPRGNAGSVA